MNVRKKIQENETLRNIFALFSGTALAQAIPFLLAPIVSRIYSTSDFAIYADFVSIFNLVSVIITGRYSLAIVVAKSQKEAINLLVLSLIITGIISTLSFFLFLPLHKMIANLLGNANLAKWLLIMPLVVFFYGIYETFSYWLNRQKQYKDFSISKITRSIAIGTGNIGFGILNFKNTGLIIGQIIGDALASFSAILSFWKKDKENLKLLNVNEIKHVAVLYKAFPMYNSIQAFADKFKESAIILIISTFFSDNISGAYFFGFKYIQAPIALIVYSLYQVFYQKFSDKFNKSEKLYPALIQILKKSIIFAAFLFLIIFFTSEPLFSFVFGKEWEIAGSYVKLLAPMLAINFVSSQISFLPLILKKQNIFLYISLFNNILTPLFVFLMALKFNNIQYVISILSISESIILTFILIWLIQIVKKYDKNLSIIE